MRKTKKTLLAFCFIVVFASAFSIVSPLFVPAAHAALTPAEQQECYDRYNGKPASEIGVVLENQCFVQNACNFSSNDLDAVARCTTVSGSDPTENIARATAAPTVTLVCGTAPSSNSPSAGAAATYANCANAVRATFDTACVNTVSEEARTDAEKISGISSCITPSLNRISGGNRVTEAQVRTAVASGLDAAEKAANEAGTERRKTECENSGGTWENNECIPADESIEPVCDGGALGWIICPLTEIAANVTEQVAEQIENLMTFQPLLSREKNSQGAVLYTIWSTVVGLANILLVIAFLVVIFSQATSIGLSNYGIKKMLPRIIAAAILMNLSFFICAIAIDISNILGQGVRGIIASAIDALPSVPEIKEAGGNADLQNGATWGEWIGGAATLLVALGVGAATGTLGVILVALASIATFVFTAFVMLALRNVLLALVIIVAPLAFVAMILPGTNGLFTKWRKLFTGLLILFPLIMLLLYGGMLISHIILFTYDPNAGSLERIFVVLVAAIAAVAGIIAAPTAFNALLGVVGKVTAGRLNNPAKGVVDRTKNWQKARGKRIRGNNAARMASAEWGKKWGYNEDGSKKNTKGARLARGLGVGAGGLAAGARFTGGYGARRERKHKWQEENAHRIQEEQIFERLGEIDETTGRATARAERFAASAAGAGGSKNAERIMQLSREAQTNEFIAERKRSINDLDNSGLYAPGSNYQVWSDDRKEWVDIGADTGGGAHALALGKKVRITNAAGAMREFSGRDSGGMVGKAAIEMATAASDGSAITRMQGLKTAGYMDKADVDRVNNEGTGVAAEFGDSLNQSMGANASKNAQKFQSLYSGPDALNGAGDETVAQWHGGQWLIAGHQINYLREQGKTSMAKAEAAAASASTDTEREAAAAQKKAAQKQIDDAEAYVVKIKEEFRQVRDGESRMSGLYSKGKEEAFQNFAGLVDGYATTGERAKQYDHLFAGGGVGPKKEDYTTAS